MSTTSTFPTQNANTRLYEVIAEHAYDCRTSQAEALARWAAMPADTRQPARDMLEQLQDMQFQQAKVERILTTAVNKLNRF